MPTKQRYHFDFGDSSNEMLGCCAAVLATSREDAVEKLRKAMSASLNAKQGSDPDVEYIEVLINPNPITAADIDDEFEVESASQPEAAHG